MTTRSTRRAAEAAVLEAAKVIVDRYAGFQELPDPINGWLVHGPTGRNVTYVGPDTHALIRAGRALDALGLEQIDDGRAPHSLNAENETSAQAAALIAPKVGSIRREVLNQLVIALEHGLTGYTCDQLEARLRRPHTTVSSAVNDLLNKRWLRDSGLRRPTQAGRPATVWALTGRALAAHRKGELS